MFRSRPGARIQGGGSLDVHIEEDHHHVLPHILGAVGKKKLPLSGNVMLHLDAHPDLLLSKDLTHEICFDKRALEEATDIENWVLPCAYTGVINDIVWLKPPWSSQISDGVYEFQIGRRKDADSNALEDNEDCLPEIAVTAELDYFISDGLYCDPSNLTDAKDVTLFVTENPHEVVKFLEEKASRSPDFNLILDVDLDYYSVNNPFLSLHEEVNLYERLRPIYFPNQLRVERSQSSSQKEILRISKLRSQHLSELNDLFEWLDQGGNPENYMGKGRKHLERLTPLLNDLASNYTGEDLDWTVVHNAGCTIDETDLPHHISSQRDLDDLFNSTCSLLNKLTLNPQLRPKMVTVARSSLDEFCPPDQVDHIQERFILVLRKFLNEQEIKVVHHYNPEIQ